MRKTGTDRHRPINDVHPYGIFPSYRRVVGIRGRAASSCFSPGLKVADGADLRKVDWNMIFFAAGCLSIGMVAGTIGIGDLIGSFAVPVMEGKSHTLVLFLVYIGYFLLNFIMTPMAINVTFAMPLAQVAHDIGLNPVALYILMNEASDQIIMPYETVIYLIYFSFGMMRMKDFIKFYSVKTLVHILFTFLLLIPWWKFTGFLSLPTKVFGGVGSGRGRSGGRPAFAVQRQGEWGLGGTSLPRRRSGRSPNSIWISGDYAPLTATCRLATPRVKGKCWTKGKPASRSSSLNAGGVGKRTTVSAK